MSGKIAGLVWDMALPKEEKYTLLAYADHADHEGYGVRPSYDLISWKTGYNKRHVMRIVARLEEKGIMVVTKRGGSKPDGTLGKTNEWFINTEVAPKTPPRQRKGRVTPRTPPNMGGDSQDTHMRVTPVSPQTSVEPSLKDSLSGNKKRRQKDWLWENVMIRSFCAQTKLDRLDHTGEVSRIVSSLRKRFFGNNYRATAVNKLAERATIVRELRAAYRWHARLRDRFGKPLHPPNKPSTVWNLIERYRAHKAGLPYSNGKSYDHEKDVDEGFYV